MTHGCQALPGTGRPLHRLDVPVSIFRDMTRFYTSPLRAPERGARNVAQSGCCIGRRPRFHPAGSGVITIAQVDRAVLSNLTVTQSLLVIWPQIVALIAVSCVLFAVAFAMFMRQEVRA